MKTDFQICADRLQPALCTSLVLVPNVYVEPEVRGCTSPCRHSILPLTRTLGPDLVLGATEISYRQVCLKLNASAVHVWEVLALERSQTTGTIDLSIADICECTQLSEHRVDAALTTLRDVGLLQRIGSTSPHGSGRFAVIRLVRGYPEVGKLFGTGKCVVPHDVAMKLATMPIINRGGKRPGAGRPTNEERQRCAIEANTVSRSL